MKQKAYGIVLFTCLLLAAGGLGYWDMLNSGTSIDAAGTDGAQGRDGTDPSALADADSRSSASANDAVDGPASSSAGVQGMRGGEAPAEAAITAPSASRDAATAGAGGEWPSSSLPSDKAMRGSSAAVGTSDDTSSDTSPRLTPASSNPAGSTGGSPTDAADPAEPSFDLLRVEPDGSAVIAGRAAPGSNVSLKSGSREIGRTEANAAGEFVVVLADPLPPGGHEIRIEAKAADGASKLSQDVAVVNVPESGKQNELMAMITRPDEPSRIVAAPTAEDPTAATGDTSRPPRQAAVEPAAAISQMAGSTPEAAKPANGLPGLRVEAVEVDADRVYIAGSAKAGSRLRIYIDDEPLAEAEASAGDRFYVASRHQLEVGDHTVRADQLGADGSVTSRVEVPFARPDGASASAVADAGPSAAGGGLSVEGQATDEPNPRSGSSRAELSAPDRSAGPAASRTLDAATSVGGKEVSADATKSTLAGDGDGSQAPELLARSDDGAEATVPTIRQAPLTPVDGRVLIRKGDNLWNISRATYGEGRRFTVIYVANGRQIRDPNLIYPGQVFRLPRDEAASSTETSSNEVRVSD